MHAWTARDTVWIMILTDKLTRTKATRDVNGAVTKAEPKDIGDAAGKVELQRCQCKRYMGRGGEGKGIRGEKVKDRLYLAKALLTCHT